MLVAACSGAEESDLFGADGNAKGNGGASGATNETPATTSDSTTPSPGSETPAKPNAPPVPGGGDPGTKPGDPTPACAAEGLANDEFKSADVFDSCIAGKLVARDVDFVTTTAPADAKQIFIKHAESGGKVAYRVFVNGFSASFTDNPPDSIPAVANAKYTFKVEPSGTAGDRTWQLEVSFQ